MPRQARVAPGGIVYHALNRAVARLPLFQNEGDYEAFERVLIEALDQHPIRVLGYCMMPNHWHFILWPKAAGELTANELDHVDPAYEVIIGVRASKTTRRA